MVRIPARRAPTHPGEKLLEEFLKPLGLTGSELAERIGVLYPRVNELLHGKRDMTPDTALRLERFFGVEAPFWLNSPFGWDFVRGHTFRRGRSRAIGKIQPLRVATG